MGSLFTEKGKVYYEKKHPLIKQFCEELEGGQLPTILEKKVMDEVANFINFYDLNSEFKNNNRKMQIEFAGRSYIIVVDSCEQLHIIPKKVYDRL